MAVALPASIEELVKMHHYRRPAGSATEQEFIDKYIAHLPGVYRDDYGNYIGVRGDNPHVMWSSHTDTIHHEPGYQTLEWGDNVLSLASEEKKSNCLGADCTVGVWIMRELYLYGKPGLYIWHAEEEGGGKGSSYIAEVTPELVKNITIAIALDRRSFTSVITEQLGGRCCSDKFANSLAKQLGHGYTIDNGGTFTDTANYTHLIAECTNISVGYRNEHSKSETLNTAFALQILKKLKKVNLDKLVVERVPGPRSYKWDFDSWHDNDFGSRRPANNKYGGYSPNIWRPPAGRKPTTKLTDNQLAIEELLYAYSEEMAIMLDSLNIDAAELQVKLAGLKRKKIDDAFNNSILYRGE